MMSIKKIWANATYEMTILFRGWFFRIFAGLTISLFVFLDIILFSEIVGTPRIFRAISSFFPYAKLMLLNIGQSAMIIFLASDIFKREKKMNTSEVFYIRSVTNAEFLFGKALGVLIAFSLLDILVLIITSVFHIAFNNLTFNVVPYLIYPFILILPTAIFVMGMTFFLMRLFRNQAVVIFMMLGIIAFDLFIVKEKWFYIIDFVGFNLPMVYSNLAGLPFIDLILMQRGIYLFAGLIFIFISILFLERLPQSDLMKKILVSASVMLLLLIFLFSIEYLNSNYAGQRQRIQIKKLNEQYVNIPTVTITRSLIHLKHYGNNIKVNNDLYFQNNNESNLNSYYFSLNPGLKVANIEHAGEKIEFEQSQHIVLIKPKIPLAKAEADSLKITYFGEIDENVCFLDIDEEKREKIFRLWFYRIGKKYAFLNDDYVLLPAESMWYPQAGLPYGMRYPFDTKKSFIEFELNVKTNSDLTAISQGNTDTTGGNTFRFKPEKLLPQISLVIGNYEKKSLTVDSVQYNLYRSPGHNYYESFFTQINDTLPSLIRELRQDFERNLGIEYPFKRISLIEVPIQFYSYPRLWTVGREDIQPEQIWIPENAAYIDDADFSFINQRRERRTGRMNQTFTEEETQSQIFSRFVKNTFLGSEGFKMFISRNLLNYNFNLNSFPTFVSHTVNFHSKEWPIFNAAFESYLFDKINQTNQRPGRNFAQELTEAEKVCRILVDQSLAEYLSKAEDKSLLSEMVKLKGAYLFKAIQSETKPEEFARFTTDFVKNNRFKSTDVAEFVNNLNSLVKFDLEQYFQNWYQGKNLPGFIISAIEMFKILDADRIRYQVRFNIYNAEPNNGLFEIDFIYGGRERQLYGMNESDNRSGRIIRLKSGETKDVGIVLDAEPRVITINSLLSKNLPIVYTTVFEKADDTKYLRPFDGERLLNAEKTISNKKELIVDNEDKGFRLYNPPHQSLIKRLIHGDSVESRAEFVRFSYWHPPYQWQLLKNASFYGEYVHSAYYVGPGNGEREATWKAKLSEPGLYYVYSYITDVYEQRHRRRSREMSDFHYSIYHDDGIDEVVLNTEAAQDGWNLLGAYYFSNGEAEVKISNKSTGSVVIADAIKWVKK